MLRSLRYATRSLVRSPAYAAGVVLTFTIGIGACAVAATAARGLLARPLPHDQGERIMYLRQSAPGHGVDNALFSVPEIDDLRAGAPSFSGIAEFSAMRFAALDLDRPRELHVGIVSGGYFEVMGLEAIHGRTLGAGDDGVDAAPVAVLTERAWRSIFGGDPGVVGRTFRMNGHRVTVVGVAEPHPPYPERTDLYVNMATSPHHLGATMTQDRTHRMTEVFARLAPGASLERGASEVEAVVRASRSTNPGAYDPGGAWQVRVVPLERQLVGRARSTLGLLALSALLTLGVATANVANLLLARASRLRGELAVRRALGAHGGDLRARLVFENLVVGAGAGLLGAAVAVPGSALVARFVAPLTVLAPAIRPDPWVLVGSLATAMATAVAIAWIPRLEAERPRPASRLRGALVAAQIAVSLALVHGGASVWSALNQAERAPTGLELARVLALDVPRVRDGRSARELADDHERIARAVGAVPGVRGAALTNQVPLRGDGVVIPWYLDVVVEGAETPPSATRPRADLRTVSPGYFEALGMTLVEGRSFEFGDDRGAARVAVVNQAFVRQYLGGRPATGLGVSITGEVVRFAGVSGEPRTIVGVVGDALDDDALGVARPALFVPHAQEPFGASLVVRTDDAPPADLLPAIERAIRQVVPVQPVENAEWLADARSRGLSSLRLRAQVAGVLALLALAVAASGVASALAFQVSVRAREMGVRAALGADRTELFVGVMAGSAPVVLLGLGAGVLAALVVGGLLGHFVEGISAVDPLLLAGAAAALALVAGLGAAGPALRASRADPRAVLGGGRS